MNRVLPIGHPEANGPESHIIHPEAGLQMILAAEGAGPFHSVTFLNEALKALIATPQAVATRFSFARNEHGYTLVALPVDASKNTILNSIALENGEQCPPFC